MREPIAHIDVNMKTNSNLFDGENRVTVSQKSGICGEIRFTFGVGNRQEIDDQIRARAERELLLHGECQRSYYDLLLVTPSGEELDFETGIL